MRILNKREKKTTSKIGQVAFKHNKPHSTINHYKCYLCYLLEATQFETISTRKLLSAKIKFVSVKTVFVCIYFRQITSPECLEHLQLIRNSNFSFRSSVTLVIFLSILMLSIWPILFH